jgi:hypothetical protein
MLHYLDDHEEIAKLLYLQVFDVITIVGTEKQSDSENTDSLS